MWKQLHVGPVHINDLLLVLLLGLTGLLVALGVTVFEALVQHLFTAGFTWGPALLRQYGLPGVIAFPLVPALIGLFIPLLKRLVPAGERQHAIPQVIIALLRREGRISLRSLLTKTASAILTLGSGGSLGREGPVVLLGSGIGSNIGQLLRLPTAWTKTLVAGGAAAAIAAAFHAPLAGLFFGLEIVLTEFQPRAFTLVAVAAMSAAGFTGMLSHPPSYPIGPFRLASPWALLLYLLLGVAAGLLSRLYVGVLERGEALGSRLLVPAAIRPALAGLLFGLLGTIAPQSLGGGYEVIDQALHGQMAALVMLGLLLIKLVAIGLTIGGGWPGGTFAPALYLGTMLGGAFGLGAQALLPNVAGSPSTYTLVGMAALVAGATHAPLTGLALCLELTRQYGMILPAAIACGAAALISQRISPFSVDTLHLHHEGVLLPWQVADLRSVPVSAAMSTSVHTARTDMTIGDLIQQMQNQRHGGYPVLDETGRLVGMITLRDIRSLPLEGRLAISVSRAMRQPVYTIQPQKSLAHAALLMAKHEIGRLPVVESQASGRLVGIISRSDILTALPQAEINASSQVGI